MHRLTPPRTDDERFAHYRQLRGDEVSPMSMHPAEIATLEVLLDKLLTATIAAAEKGQQRSQTVQRTLEDAQESIRETAAFVNIVRVRAVSLESSHG